MYQFQGEGSNVISVNISTSGVSIIDQYDLSFENEILIYLKYRKY